MATPFPSLPRINDDSLDRWSRQLRHRSRPRARSLAPAATASPIGSIAESPWARRELSSAGNPARSASEAALRGAEALRTLRRPSTHAAGLPASDWSQPRARSSAPAWAADSRAATFKADTGGKRKELFNPTRSKSEALILLRSHGSTVRGPGFGAASATTSGSAADDASPTTSEQSPKRRGSRRESSRPPSRPSGGARPAYERLCSQWKAKVDMQNRIEDDHDSAVVVEQVKQKMADERQRIKEEQAEQKRSAELAKSLRREKKMMNFTASKEALAFTASKEAFAFTASQEALAASRDLQFLLPAAAPPEPSPAASERSERAPSIEPAEAAPAASADDDDDAGRPRTPMRFDLPQWYPDAVPLVAMGGVRGHAARENLQPPPKPVVKCVGAGKIKVRWSLPTSMHLSTLWHVRLRVVDDKGRRGGWMAVDLDSGRADVHHGEGLTWKHRALVVQPGIRVWSYCIEDGHKSKIPQFGTIASHFPGFVAVHFDSTGLQGVPQDWVQFAATTKGAKDMQEEIQALIEQSMQEAIGELSPEQGGRSGSRASKLWRKATKNWWRAAAVPDLRKFRSQRQCPLICITWLDEPDAGDRVAISCAMAVTTASSGSKGRRVMQRSTTRGLDAQADNALYNTTYTWWPALRCDMLEETYPTLGIADLETHFGFDSDGDDRDRPEDLCARLDVPVKLEPWPRVQVIPARWLCTATESAQLAAENACVGQEVLANYKSYTDMVPSDEVEASLMQPPERQPGDCTFVDLDAAFREGISRSERAVRCTICREFVAVEDVFVSVRLQGSKTVDSIPLAEIIEILGTANERRFRKGAYKKRRVRGWLFKRRGEGERGFAEIYGRQSVERQTSDEDALEEVILLRAGVDVRIRGSAAVAAGGKKLGYNACSAWVSGMVVDSIVEEATRYEVHFEDVVPASTQYVSGEALRAVFESGCEPERVQWPAVLVHDLPESMSKVEVQVGVSSGTSRLPQEDNVFWSEPSGKCTVLTRNPTLLAPVGPAARPCGISKADLRWIFPESPEALCFRVRMRTRSSGHSAKRDTASEAWREVDSDYKGSGRRLLRDDATGAYWEELEEGFGEQDWDIVNALGRICDPDASMAWQHRITPLAPDMWVLTHGQIEGIPSATPAAAVVQEILDDTNVKVQFATPVEDLHIGFSNNLMGHSISMGGMDGDPQVIPVEYIEAVWCKDGADFFKGKPSSTCRHAQKIRFTQGATPNRFDVHLVEGDGKVEGLAAEAVHLSSSVYGPSRVSDGVFMARGTVGHVVLQSLQPNRDYEICVQALTLDGWTPWTEACLLQMPDTGHFQETLVVERQVNVMYKSPLLPHAFYKQYQLCREHIRNALPPERYARIKSALGGSRASQSDVDPALQGLLVSMSSPIRSSKSMSGSESRLAIRSAVERGADLNYHVNAVGRTPLIFAIEYFWSGVKFDCIEELVALRADINATNDLRQTALILAAELGQPRIVQYLLELRADCVCQDRQGKTAYLSARELPRHSWREREDIRKVRALLAEDRVPWDVFQEQVLDSEEDPERIAEVFLDLAFPDAPSRTKRSLFVGDPSSRFGKRICKWDRLRLYEHILEAREEGEDAMCRRGELCGQRLLLPMMKVASTPPGSEACGLVTWYLLYSDIARFVLQDIGLVADEILEECKMLLLQAGFGLQILKEQLTEAPMIYCKGAASTEEYNGNPLHQWHGHGTLMWLAEQNVVNTFEELIRCGAFGSLEEFCNFVGGLNAKIYTYDTERSVQHGAWHHRVPYMFWGSIYTQWLLRQAHIVAPVFHAIAHGLVEKVAGAAYDEPPNKGIARVDAKQKDYASPGLCILFEALDVMVGKFSRVIRADLPEIQEMEPDAPVESLDAAILVVGSIRGETVREEDLERITQALQVASRYECEVLQADDITPEQSLVDDAKAVRDAAGAVAQMGPAHFAQLQKLSVPPPSIKLVGEGVAMLLRPDQKLEAAPAPGGKFVSHHWAMFQGDLLADIDAMLRAMGDFNVDAISDETRARLDKVTKSKDFKLSFVQKAMPSCAPLFHWLQAVHWHMHSVRGARSRLTGSRSLSITSGAKPVIVLALVRGRDTPEEPFGEACDTLSQHGVDALVWSYPDELQGGSAKEMLRGGLRSARERRGLPEDNFRPRALDVEHAKVLFEIRKCKTGHVNDLLCAGGLLDLVRGSIKCKSEEAVVQIYELAMQLTIEEHGCQVVRIKNGFHPKASTVGGYADLKLFLRIAKDGERGQSRFLHICELQVHLENFLALKKYSHLPYQVKRGDFNPS